LNSSRLGQPATDMKLNTQILHLILDLRVHLIDTIARSTPGFVGADLVSMANKASNLAMKSIIDRRKSELSDEWWRQPWTPEEMEALSITMADFEEAANMVQPSSTREGFTATPNVKCEGVGAWRVDLLRKEFNWYIVSRIKHRDDYAVDALTTKRGKGVGC
ncbi:Cell division control protein 48-like protein, partial [Thalictrum thalictroides]